MNNELLSCLGAIEDPFLNESFGTNESFMIEPGTIPVMVSAPHSVSQRRQNTPKQGEFRSGTIVRMLRMLTQCHCIYKTRNDQDDANFDEENPYRTKLVEYIKQNQISHLIDLHIMSPLRNHDIDLGTAHGVNIGGNYGLVASIAQILAYNGISNVGVDRLFTAANPNTVSSTVFRETQIFALQIEMNWRLLDLPLGGESFLRVVESLERFIQFLQGEWV